MKEKNFEVKILRFNPDVDDKPYYTIYKVPLEDGMSLMDVLDYIYKNVDSTLAYYSHTACRRGVCGRCTLMINGKASLACQTIVQGDVTIEPPSKFQVIRDLVYTVPKRDETIPLSEAKKEIEITSRRIALLHLSYAKTIIEKLGEEKGLEIIAKAIKDYGIRIGERTREEVKAKGLSLTPENFDAGESLRVPKFGMHSKIEIVNVDGESRIRAYDCVLAKLWKEYGEEKLGRLYCYVDVAKYIAYNPNYKLVHTKAIPSGDDYCEFTIKKTTKKEREDFLTGNKIWFYMDK
ncbi:MAG: 2Fe-2S iron-sulfur cluster-binding protein [Candidatus Bathyarchaeia archaeon]